jgi:hypothetical protein
MLLIGSADCSSIQRLRAAFTLVRSPIPSTVQTEAISNEASSANVIISIASG